MIVIDEPEMNLHPEAQAQLMELLTMLVNCGLNVLITTPNVRSGSGKGGVNQKKRPDRVTGAVTARNMPSNYDTP